MMIIYTKLNLQQYISRIENQKYVLAESTFISENCKNQMLEIYDTLKTIATTELDFINAKEIQCTFEIVSK